MKDKKNRRPDSVPPEGGENGDEALFSALGKSKRRKKVRRWITAIVILALLGTGGYFGVKYGRQKLNEKFSDFDNMYGYGMMPANQVVPYVVDTGSVTTTVSGSGQLADVGSEKLTLPGGVKVDRVLVNAGERVTEGQMLATVEPSSVLSALSEAQSKIGELDGKLNSAAYDVAPAYINAGVNGRVKAVYAAAEDDVATVMVKNGALAVLSLDGFMAADVPSAALKAGDPVQVRRADGSVLTGTVDTVVQDVATVLVGDDGPALDETVTVLTPEGEQTASLYIHSPLRVTGYAGTVSYCNIRENQPVWIGNNLFGLRDTAYTANYESVLRQRREQEEKLLQLMDVYGVGGLRAPFDGTVVSIEYKDPSAAQTGGSETGGDLTGLTGLTGGETGGQSGQTTPSETALLTLSPDEEMTVNISVSETDILSLQVGQDAQITINSIDEVFPGVVTAINRLASDNSGGMNPYEMSYTGATTNYTAVVTLTKDPRMLPGMSARAVIRIQGVENTILIPAAALHQTSDTSFVYTTYDEETQELGGAVSVVPGLNDGYMVEIIEGLQNGDMVYYIEVFDPYSYYSFGSDGNASGGNAWVDMGGYASQGDASDGDAMVFPEDGEFAPEEYTEGAAPEVAP